MKAFFTDNAPLFALVVAETFGILAVQSYTGPQQVQDKVLEGLPAPMVPLTHVRAAIMRYFNATNVAAQSGTVIPSFGTRRDAWSDPQGIPPRSLLLINLALEYYSNMCADLIDDLEIVSPEDFCNAVFVSRDLGFRILKQLEQQGYRNDPDGHRVQANFRGSWPAQTPLNSVVPGLRKRNAQRIAEEGPHQKLTSETVAGLH